MIPDSDHRRKAIEETNRSFVVEASAGTGKTTTLIRRILHLVLERGPSGVPLPLSRICAITFTEKAASEMKLRLRQHFEEVVSGKAVSGYLVSDSMSAANPANSESSSPMPILTARAREALRDLETASISTFHSFAVSLLKERPVEAGLDPHFTALDEIKSELFFKEVWESWIGRALAERRPALENALRKGLRLDNLEVLARTLRLNGHAVRVLKFSPLPSEDEIRGNIQDLLQRGGNLIEKARNSNDKLIDYLEKALHWLRNPEQNSSRPSKPGKAGAAANWTGGKETVQVVQSFVREVTDFCSACRNLPAQRLLNDLIRWMIDDFLPEWERRKRAGGLLDFDDQLWLARDLLFKSKAVRREFQTRYAALLVDEFQDTDAVQWDIVRLLSSADSEEADPARFRPGPGKVFIVGDPKQSIYRFRNADIETYLEIVDPRSMDALGLERLQLTTNFRSVPSILRFVDAAFDGLMKAPSDGCYQPDYLPFGDRGDRTTESSSPAVSLLGEKTTESNSARTVREFLEIEASRIAKLIHQMRGSEAWKIQDSGGGKGSPWRPPRYGDIAVLLPVLSRADILEEALRDMEIPYVLEGGKFYYARSEVSSAITVLRAVANPNDSVALYGALRSIFFGLSDEDLLRAHIEKQPLDYRADVPQQSPLYFPFEILRDLHRHRHDRRASESFEILLQRTGAREVLAVRGFQSLANLNKLGRTLRTLQGEATFSQVVNLLSMMDEEDLAESESRLMEERSDAVRVMSIHRAKGLDFPIVFVASLGLKKRNRTRSLLADFHHKKIFGLSIGSKESGLQTPGWSELSEEEKKRETAELVRLLYVGLTRARDHLVLSTHTQNWKMLEGSDKYVPDTKETRLKPLDSFLERCLSEKSDLIRWVDVDDLDASAGARRAATLPDGRDWSAAVEREYAELHALLDSTPTAESLQPAGQGAGAFDNEDRAHEDRAPEAAATRAIRLGMAFHEAMERVNLNNMDDLDEYAQASGIRHKLDRENVRELERMIRTSWSSDLLERARAATCSGGKVLRELPFVRPLSLLTVEEGKIDLLFEEADGWVLVDYKTDWVQKETEKAEDFFRNKYAAQIQEYIEALRALSVKVQSAYLLLARTGGAVRMI